VALIVSSLGKRLCLKEPLLSCESYPEEKGVALSMEAYEALLSLETEIQGREKSNLDVRRVYGTE